MQRSRTAKKDPLQEQGSCNASGAERNFVHISEQERQHFKEQSTGKRSRRSRAAEKNELTDT